jgi:hypothetical protein
VPSRYQPRAALASLNVILIIAVLVARGIAEHRRKHVPSAATPTCGVWC